LWRSPDQIRDRIGGRLKRFKPTMREAERGQLLALWHDAVSRTLTKTRH
jgi:glycerol kinase